MASGMRRQGQPMPLNTVLVAGASGLVGSAAVEHFAALPGWRVIALSRRRPALPPAVDYLQADLADPQSCRAAADSLGEVTHVVFAALYEKPDLVAGWRDHEQMHVNLSMLRGVEPIRNPAKERWPRHPHENFYWLQEDLLRARQPGRDWTFTILRPQVIFGNAVGSPMNAVAAVGAYAAVMRELGHPLCFPGGGAFVNGATDARLLARAMAFAGTSPVAANETYNVVNGDVLVWQDIWASIAAHFGMPAGPAEPLRLAEAMPGREDVWQRIVVKHGLQPLTLAQLAGSSWQFTDRALGHGQAHPADSVLSPIKLRQAGFHDCEDTEDCLLYWLRRMQSERLLPP
jgi:nucleoside-diphosphate-sugar epimerase